MADYCTLAWFRSHGFEIDDYPDEVVNTAIRESSLFIDDFTGMWFDERIKTFKLDGSGTNFMYFAIPIVSISEVNYTNPVTGDTQELTVATDVAIYNRDYPDDRLNPKIRLNSGTGVFPVGKMNIEVKGVFGFTVEDSDIFGPTVCSGVVDGENTTFTVSEGAYVAGTLTPYVDDVEQSGFSETDPENGIFNLTVPPEEGAEVTSKFQKTETRITPLDIIRVCRLLVGRDLNHPIEDLYAQAELDMQAKVKKEKTDKHSIEYRDIPLGSVQLTGDHTIDGILIKYRKLRPPEIRVIR